MLTKLATFRGVSPQGEPLVRLFRQGDSIQKLAGQMMPEVKDWLGTYRSDKKKIALLINAMGGSEYWGQNVNGDVFPWDALLHDCRKHRGREHPVDSFTHKVLPNYGHWTFLEALPFVHHKNKDPSRAFGKVVVSTINPTMKRVELVAIIERDLASKFDAQHIVDRVDANEYPDVSMGCRVPYDVCTICGNKSRTRNDYCQCIKSLGIGRILEDGRMVGMVNLHPRFFDISFVFIGADKTAKVMIKLGEHTYELTRDLDGLWVPESVRDGERLYGADGESMTKAASQTPVEELVHLLEPRRRSLPRPYPPRPKIVKPPPHEGGGYSDGILPTNYADSTGWKDDPNKIAAKEKEARLIREDEIRGYAAKKLNSRIGPPPSPNRKEFPFVGTIDFRGLTIHVENKAGDVREGTSRSGKKWRTTMRYPYGEILGAKGADKEHLDVYVGPHHKSNLVFIVHQNHPADHPKAGQYDEDKIMLGFNDAEEAQYAYHAHYDRKDFYRSITAMDFESFKKMVHGGEIKGEKVAGLNLVDGLTKEAVSFRLEDLFLGAETARRRQRSWKDKTTGKETHHVGSGLGDSFATMQKTANVLEGHPTLSFFRKQEEKHARKRYGDELADAIAVDMTKGATGEWFELLKRAAHKAAAVLKEADIDKEIEPSKAVGQVTRVLGAQEKSLPKEVLDQLGSDKLEHGLASPSGMGMVLRPHEFQRILLVRIGRPDIADDLDAHHHVFGPSNAEEAPCGELGVEDVLPRFVASLLPFLENRSFLGPVAHRRVLRIETAPVHPRSEVEKESPLLSKISAAYTWYRREMLKVAAQAESIVERHPSLRAPLFAMRDTDLFVKSADALTTGAAIGAVPLTMMYSSSLRGDEQRGEELSLLAKIIAHYPNLSALGAAALVQELMKNPAVHETVQRGATALGQVAKQIWTGGA